jgi:acetolactate synthase-1/2/3 large subunit
MPNAGEAIVNAIAAAGVRRFYTVPGESFLEVLDAADRHPDTRLFSTRHESGASFMAEADAKLTGVPAVALATRGPGAANLSIGVHTAHQDSTPMLVLLGDVETALMHRGAFQEVDLTAFYAPITKLSMTAMRGDRLPDMVRHALRVATTGRPGPVMISLPADLLAEEVADRADSVTLLSPRPAPSAAELTKLADRLTAAARPVAIVGGGAQHTRTELVRFADAYHVGVYAAFRRQDVFPNDHPNYLGHLGVGTPPETLAALRAADLVLVLGCRLDQMTTQRFQLPRSSATVIQVDVAPDTLAATLDSDLAVLADPAETVRALLARPVSVPKRDWSADHEAYLRSVTEVPERSVSGVDPAHVIRSMSRAFPSDAVVTSDAGNFAVFLHRHWMFRHPCSQAAPANGAMGYAVPAGIGAKAALPNRRVVAVVGDGGFMMTGQEIETAVRYGLPITVVVMRNGMYGTIAMHQATQFGRVAATDIGPVDIAGYARSLGALGISVTKPDELDDALCDAAKADVVTVIDVVTDPELITPGSRLSELLAMGRGNRAG